MSQPRQRPRPQRQPNPLESVVSELLETNRMLTEAIIQLTMERDRLEKHIPAVPAMEIPNLAMDEDVEDKLWEHQHGLIDKGELARVLTQAGMSNTNIEIA